MLCVSHLRVRNFLEIDKLELASGQLVAICGPNGSGKSTFIDALAGYLPIQSGRIQLAGKELPDYSIQELAAVRSWLSQEPPFRAHLRVSEQLEQTVLQRALHAPTAPEVRQNVVTDVINQLSLQPLLSRSLMELSGGELQRVAIAMTLISSDRRLNPDQQLILLDEPLASLDPHYQHQVIAALLRLREQGHIILLSLHDLNLAMFYSMDVLLLRNGRLTISGAADEVLSEKRISELFGISMTQIRINGRTQLILS